MNFTELKNIDIETCFVSDVVIKWPKRRGRISLINNNKWSKKYNKCLINDHLQWKICLFVLFAWFLYGISAQYPIWLFVPTCDILRRRHLKKYEGEYKWSRQRNCKRVWGINMSTIRKTHKQQWMKTYNIIRHNHPSLSCTVPYIILHNDLT